MKLKQYTYEIYIPPYPNTEIKFRIHKGLIKENRDNFHPYMCQVGEFKALDMNAAIKVGKDWHKHYVETRRKSL